MALIRGLQSKFPCPICLIPKDQLSKLQVYPAQYPTQSQAIVSSARDASNVEECERILKEYSLHNVDVSYFISVYIFFCIICLIKSRMFFGRVQTGMFMQLFPLIICMPMVVFGKTIYGSRLANCCRILDVMLWHKLITSKHFDLKSSSFCLILYSYDSFPQWRNLIHFSKVIGITYTDGTKHENISKVCFTIYMVFSIIRYLLVL